MERVIMNKGKFILIFLAIFMMMNQLTNGQNKILIVTGGKTFDTESFHEIFKSYDIQFDTASKPVVFSLFNSERITDYDAIIFYDTYQPISPVEKDSFLNLFEKGIGIVFLHHSLVSHQEWDEYEKIVGGRYHHKPYLDDGKKYGPSTYKHDQEFIVKIIDKEHPVTKDIDDFKIHDEIYLNYKVHENVNPFLTSDNCESGKYIGWTNNYKNSKIIYLQLGHDHYAYENPNFRLLIKRSIEWVKK
jgi:uncharacterized protein